MEQHTIALPDNLYRRLIEKAEQLDMTPVQALEWLLLKWDDKPFEQDAYEPPAEDYDQESALAAVERLGNLFAGMRIEDIESILEDPMIQLINADLHELDELIAHD